MCYNRFTLYEDGLILIVMLLYFAKTLSIISIFHDAASVRLELSKPYFVTSVFRYSINAFVAAYLF